LCCTTHKQQHSSTCIISLTQKDTRQKCSNMVSRLCNLGHCHTKAISICNSYTRGAVRKQCLLFFSEAVVANKMQFTSIRVTSFTKFRLFFSQSLIHYQHTFSNCAWDAVGWSRKIPCCRVGNLQASRCSQNGFLEIHSSRVHGDGIRRWSFIYRSGRILRIRCFNFFNVYTFRSELIAAPLSKNSTKSQKTLSVTLPAEVCTLNFFLRGDVWWCSIDCLFVNGS